MSTETTTPDGFGDYLADAIHLAERNVAEGGGPFGALVVRAGAVVAAGVNRVTPDLDPTAHAEIVALRAACRALGTFSLAGCVLVSSCEPCPMCLASALWARVDEVRYAADRYDAARAGFDDLVFYRLFDTPRAAWTFPIRQVRLDAAAAPFDAWAREPDKIAY